MNASRSLARCSRLISCGLSKGWNVGKNRLSIARSHAEPKHTIFAQYLRPMSSTVKFEVMNIQDEEDFKNRVLDTSSSVPVVVDFHATWCGPCKLLGPRLEHLLSKGDGKVLMAKVDIDDNPEIAMEYGVQSVPTVVGMKNGKIQDKFVGVIDDDQISSFVDKLVVS